MRQSILTDNYYFVNEKASNKHIVHELFMSFKAKLLHTMKKHTATGRAAGAASLLRITAAQILIDSGFGNSTVPSYVLKADLSVVPKGRVYLFD